MIIVPVMLQIGSYCNNNFIINVILNIGRRGRKKISASTLFCNPKQRETELVKRLVTLCFRFEGKFLFLITVL